MSIRVKNCLLEKSSDLYWEDSSFTRDNFPNSFDFEMDVKNDIFKMARMLPCGHSIIDCGAHIGDLSIPLASALSDVGRSDIHVFAMDPSLDKCKFIRKMAEINHIKNIKVINCGLSDSLETRYPHIPIDGNTGGTCWLHERTNTNSNAHLYTTGEPITFNTLDNLVSNGDIDRPIGLIHLDVENMEQFALRGGIRTITSDVPIISLEDHTDNPAPYLFILGTIYKFSHRINNNSIFHTKVINL